MPPAHTDRQLSSQCALEAKLLAAESHRIITDIASVLHRVLQLKASPASSPSTLLRDCVPVLSLRLYPNRWATSVSAMNVPRALNAFAALVTHSQHLSAFPELKSAFWLALLDTTMMCGVAREVHVIFFKAAAFPRFAIDFSHDACQIPVDDTLGEALHAFMTTPATTQVGQALKASSPRIALGLSFAKRNLTNTSLECIERFLDRTFANPDRMYDLNMLSLSGNAMTPAALAIVARIVQKSKRLYNIGELQLEAINVCGPPETPKEFLDIVQAAYDIEKLPGAIAGDHHTYRSTSPDEKPSRLRKISLGCNSLSPDFFAALFSILRYGSSLEVDISSYSMNVEGTPDERTECFGWIAFGLFCPRPKRFENAFKLRCIGQLNDEPLAMSTYGKTLHDPGAQMVYGDTSGEYDSVSAGDLMICAVKKGARIEFFRAGGSSRPLTPMASLAGNNTLQERSELEALSVREDGCVCVVVPGVGLGWVQPEFIESIAREPLERSDQDGWFDVTFQASMLDGQMETMRSFFPVIGRQIRSLRMDFNGCLAGYMELFFEHCVNLQHLDVKDMSMNQIVILLDALSGDLGDRLLSLNLTLSSRYFPPASVERIHAILADTEKPLVLRELRLNAYEYKGAAQVASLYDALQVNRTLTLIELRIGYNTAPIEIEKDRLNAVHQGQQLHRTATPTETRLAFLSVLANNAIEKLLALQSLNSSVLSLIFEFAASREVRTIAWNVSIWKRASEAQ